MAKWGASSIFTRYFFAIIVTLYPPADRVHASASASDLTRCSNCRNASDRGRLHWVVGLRDLGLDSKIASIARVAPGCVTRGKIARAWKRRAAL